MAYQVYESHSTRKHTPTLGIRPDGRFRLNSDATLAMQEMEFERVQILWDGANHRLAFRKAAPNDHKAFKLTFSRQQNNADIAARAFLKDIGWSAKTRVDVALEWDGDQGLFEATIPKRALKQQLVVVPKKST